MRNLYVRLPDEAVDRLRELADRELRGTKEQAAFLILDGLRRAAPGEHQGARAGRTPVSEAAR